MLSSTYTVDAPQKDGRSYVREKHTDAANIVRDYNYLANAGADYAALLTAHAALLDAQLASEEFFTQLNSLDPLVLKYQTKTQFAQTFRALWKDSIKTVCAYLAYWLIEHINSGDFTDAQVQSVFGLTTTQYNNLKSTKLIPYHDAWAAALAAVGQ